jgi:hypothetical protein
MISGNTPSIARIGYPTEAFKAPIIYPYFAQAGIDAVVMPMGVKAADFVALLGPLFRLTNIRGALVTMPHKVFVVALLDEVTPTVEVAGSCNAILKRPDGSLLGTFEAASTARICSLASNGCGAKNARSCASRLIPINRTARANSSTGFAKQAAKSRLGTLLASCSISGRSPTGRTARRDRGYNATVIELTSRTSMPRRNFGTTRRKRN